MRDGLGDLWQRKSSPALSISRERSRVGTAHHLVDSWSEVT